MRKRRAKKLITFTNKINARFVIFFLVHFLHVSALQVHFFLSGGLDAERLVAKLDEAEHVDLILDDNVFGALVVVLGVSEVLQS